MAMTAEEIMTLAAFARKHHVSRKTVSRWRGAGYLVTRNGRVCVAESERRLAERPAEYRGGRTRGPTAETPCTDEPDFDLPAVIADYESLRAHCRRAVDVYDEIIEDLCALPAGSDEGDWSYVHFKHQAALRAALAPWL